MNTKLFGRWAVVCLTFLGAMTVARGQIQPTLELPVLDPLGQMTLAPQGETGTNYAIEVSRNLNAWLPLAHGTANNGRMLFQYWPGSNTPALYFRGRLDLDWRFVVSHDLHLLG
jgi:hypothetical protein